MLVLVAPDKFKGSLSALEVCYAIEKGLKQSDEKITTKLFPLADGGDGSLDILSNYIKGDLIEIEVNNSIGHKIKTKYLLENNIAYIELASASGLGLLSAQDQNPMFTSTFGTGEMILDAINKGANEIFLFVGGSSTTDAGIGIAKALGFVFYDKNGGELLPIGKNLIDISRINTSNLYFDKDLVKFTVLCDVNNLLYGKNGAAIVYAPQKGAKPLEVKELDKGLRHLSKLIKKQFNKDISKVKGGGAAGGVAAGMYGLLDAKIKSGIETIMDITGFENKVQQADWIVSGEGKFDSQSMGGKVISKVLELSSAYQKPLFLLVGINSLSPKELKSMNIYYIDSVVKRADSINDAIENASEYLTKMAFEIRKGFKL